MKKIISYNYSNEMQCEQHQLIKTHLIQQFSRLNMHCFLLIDAAILRRRKIKPEIFEVLKHRAKVKVPVAPNYLNEDFFPWLISLDLTRIEDISIFNESVGLALNEIKPEKIKRGEGRLICGWLASNASTEQLALHLGKSALQNNEENNILLRYYDPAVAPLLWNLLDNWQQRRLQGPVSHWFSIDGDGQIIKRIGFKQREYYLTYSLSISPESWEDIKLITIVNGILCEYRIHHSHIARYDELTALKIVMPALKRAGDYSFQNKDDLIAYGIHALTISPEFDRHPYISRLLNARRSQKNKSYLEAIANVSESDWENVRLGNNTPPLAITRYKIKD